MVHDSSVRCAATLYGPVPSTCLVGSNVPAASSFIGKIAAGMLASEETNELRGFSRVIRTWVVPTARTSEIGPTTPAQREASFGEMRRLTLPTTSSTVMARPLEN